MASITVVVSVSISRQIALIAVDATTLAFPQRFVPMVDAFPSVPLVSLFVPINASVYKQTPKIVANVENAVPVVQAVAMVRAAILLLITITAEDAIDNATLATVVVVAAVETSFMTKITVEDVTAVVPLDILAVPQAVVIQKQIVITVVAVIVVVPPDMVDVVADVVTSHLIVTIVVAVIVVVPPAMGVVVVPVETLPTIAIIVVVAIVAVLLVMDVAEDLAKIFVTTKKIADDVDINVVVGLSVLADLALGCR